MSHAMSQQPWGPGHPQSPDYLVRIAESALASIVFEHYCTVQDPSVMADGSVPATPGI